MALELTEGATLNSQFAHALDTATGLQVPLVALHPDSPGVGGGGGGGGTAESVVVKYLDGLTQVSVGPGAPLPVHDATTKAVIGALNDAAQQNPAAASATLLSLLRGVLGALTQYSSAGVPLPTQFGSYPVAYTYSAGKLQTESVTGGGSTWVKTYTYTGDDLTGVSGWVLQ